MQDARVVMLGFTEFVYRCIYHNEATTQARPADMLKKIKVQ